MKIIGISAYYHDSAVALVEDGKVVAALQEERFTRIKHDPAFPGNALTYLKDQYLLTTDEIEAFVFYDKPFLTFERLLETYVDGFPRGFKSFSKSIPIWVKEKIFLENTLKTEISNVFGDYKVPLLFSEHHLSHAASAFFPSPFNNAAILCMDGVGEWVSSSISIGGDNNIEVQKEMHFPHSLGLLYSAFTYYTGFRVNSGEYKLMGLAPYGAPKFKNKILDNIVGLREDGSFKLDMSYFDFTTGDRMISDKFRHLLGKPEREMDSDHIEEFYMDVAASIQAVTEEVVLLTGVNIAKETGQKNLCLAGGVALNCVANGKLAERRLFENIWVQPAAGDAGGAIGCALAAYHMEIGMPRHCEDGQDAMSGSLLGMQWSNDGVEQKLNEMSIRYKRLEPSEKFKYTAELIQSGSIIGWFQGRSEFGPRALGARSILADPRSQEMQSRLNLKTKFREGFRPFAPAILEEHFDDYFSSPIKNPYMLFVSQIAEKHKNLITKEDLQLTGLEKLRVNRSSLPPVTHVDYSARAQTVNEINHPDFYKLITAFFELTGVPVLINTSFNVRGEPIVNTPEEAVGCLLSTEMDYLIIEDFLVERKAQGNHYLSYQHRELLD